MRLRASLATVVLCLSLGLTGCTLNTTALPGSEPGPSITGAVHGGRQPVVGAQVYLLAANTTGYGNASLSLLNSVPGKTTLDTSSTATNGDYFVTTDSGGNFTITGDYSCTAGQQVYLYAAGGNPGSGTNSGASFLAILGNCTGGTSAFASSTPNVVMNEVSTIAASYAFAGFATDPLHVSSSGTALALTGIANAFDAAANLVTVSTGQALSVTPGGTGAVPQSEIDTLANILAACVNSTGPTSASCNTLFTNAKNGSNTPSDTATAAINIAHNPGANISALLGLQSTTPPFLPKLPASPAPNDWTMGLYFTGSDLTGPGGLAVDASGNLWLSNSKLNTTTFNFNTDLVEFNHLGVPITGSPGYTGGGLGANAVTSGGTLPQSTEIDSSGNIWVLAIGTSYNGVAEFSSTGTAMSPSPTGYTGAGVSTPFKMAFDASGNLWLTNQNLSVPTNSISKFNSSGTYVNSYTGGGLKTPGGIVVDNSGNLWIANQSGGASNNGNISKFDNTGTAISGTQGYNDSSLLLPTAVAADSSNNIWIINETGSVSKFDSTGAIVSSGFTGGGQINLPSSITIDGTGNLWIGNYSTITELNSAGTAISPSTGYTGPVDSTYPSGLITVPIIAIDGSGNVWSTSGHGQLIEFVGAASPVVTPIATATKNHTVGMRP